MRQIKNQNAGFLSLEIVLSLCLISSLTLAVMVLVFTNQYLIVDTENNQIALSTSSTGMEEARAEGFYFIPPADEVENGFQKHLETKWLSDYAKAFISKTSYTSEARAQVVELNSLLADWQNGPSNDTCALFFQGNWQNPQAKGLSQLSVSEPITDIDVNENLAFVSANGNTSAMEDFFIFKVDDINNPQQVTKLNTGPGLNAVHIAGDYAFVANSSINGQLEIIKLNRSTNPPTATLINSKKLTDYLGNIALGIGQSIYYYRQKLFVGTVKNSGPEFFIYDVSNPQAPTPLGSFELNTAVNDIYVHNTTAYLALAQGKEIIGLDFSNPYNIQEINSYTPPGALSQSGQSIAGLGDYAFLGRAGGLPALGYKELYILEKTNIPNPPANFDLNASINKIFVRDGLIFLATNDSGKEFKIFKFTNSQLTPFAELPLTDTGNALDCENENLFVTSNDGKLQIISAQ